VPHSSRVARVWRTGPACGREVTVGDAPAVEHLGSIRQTIRRCIGEPATLMPEVTDAMVDAVLRVWPSDWASLLARSSSWRAGEAFYRLTILVRARAREYIEWRYGMSRNVQTAIAILLERVVDEVAMFWLESAEHRNAIRQAINAARKA
jgi:hypothetical protein